LRRRHPVVIFLGVAIEVLAELRQLRRADEALALDHLRRVDLAVALLDVNVDHPADERALQARPNAAQEVEARAGDLDAALEVDDPELGPEIPVRLGREGERALVPDLAQDLV